MRPLTKLMGVVTAGDTSVVYVSVLSGQHLNKHSLVRFNHPYVIPYSYSAPGIPIIFLQSRLPVFGRTATSYRVVFRYHLGYYNYFCYCTRFRSFFRLSSVVLRFCRLFDHRSSFEIVVRVLTKFLCTERARKPRHSIGIAAWSASVYGPKYVMYITT